jgi:uncharacterized protein with HEPN domain
MQKDDGVYVGPRCVLDMARKASGLAAGKDRAAYDADEALRLALTHLVQVIGEAARHVSTEYSADHPEVPWLAIIGMRHKVVHDYMAVDEDIVWHTIQEDLPTLITLLEAIAPPDEPESKA